MYFWFLNVFLNFILIPGMHNGFKGLLPNQNYKMGYIAIKRKLYTIFRCDRKLYY